MLITCKRVELGNGEEQNALSDETSVEEQAVLLDTEGVWEADGCGGGA